MPRIRLNAFALAFITLLVTSACDSNVPRDQNYATAETRIFSEAEKAAAQTLSIADAQALETMSDPTEKALACSRSIGFLVETLQGTDALTDVQSNAIEQARLIYERQIPADYEAEDTADDGSAPTDIASDAEINPAQEARIALACLRNLQDQQ